MVTPNNFGEYIKAERKKRGLKAIDVAKKAGLSASELSRIESGKHEVRYKTLERLTEIIGCMPIAILCAWDLNTSCYPGDIVVLITQMKLKIAELNNK